MIAQGTQTCGGWSPAASVDETVKTQAKGVRASVRFCCHRVPPSLVRPECLQVCIYLYCNYFTCPSPFLH